MLFGLLVSTCCRTTIVLTGWWWVCVMIPRRGCMLGGHGLHAGRNQEWASHNGVFNDSSGGSCLLLPVCIFRLFTYLLHCTPAATTTSCRVAGGVSETRVFCSVKTPTTHALQRAALARVNGAFACAYQYGVLRTCGRIGRSEMMYNARLKVIDRKFVTMRIMWISAVQTAQI